MKSNWFECLAAIVAVCAAILFAAAPATSTAAIIVAGELTADMRNSDLSASSNVWVNQDTTGETVGDFTKRGAGNLNVVTVAGVPALNIAADGNNSAHSALAATASMLGSSVGSVESWVYVPTVPGFVANNTIVAWGTNVNPGAGNPRTNRGFRFAAPGSFGSGMFTGWFMDVDWENPGILIPDKWTHIAWVTDGLTYVKGYINGVLINNETPIAEILGTTSTTVSIGSRTGGSGSDAFRGSVAGVRIHTGILSADDVLNNFRQGIGVPEPGTFVLAALGFGCVLFRRRK